MQTSEVDKLIRRVWGEQGWQIPGAYGGMSLDEARAAGIKRLIENRYPNFEDRVAAVTTAIDALMQRRGSKEALLAVVAAQLPFLTKENQLELTQELIDRSERL